MTRLSRILIAAALTLGSLLATALPAAATECTPKGCTGGCRIDVRDWSIDENGNVSIGPPITCYS